MGKSINVIHQANEGLQAYDNLTLEAEKVFGKMQCISRIKTPIKLGTLELYPNTLKTTLRTHS